MINYKLQDFKTEGIDLEAFNTSPAKIGGKKYN